jgi:hypothetical protein
MKIFDEFGECMHKIRYIERGTTDEDIAIALQMPVTTYREHKKRRHLPVENILKYCKDKSIDIEWLMLKRV